MSSIWQRASRSYELKVSIIEVANDLDIEQKIKLEIMPVRDYKNLKYTCAILQIQWKKTTAKKIKPLRMYILSQLSLNILSIHFPFFLLPHISCKPQTKILPIHHQIKINLNLSYFTHSFTLSFKRNQNGFL